jgi:HAE1 family hydrophobic/amphiphilic exporter-1
MGFLTQAKPVVVALILSGSITTAIAAQQPAAPAAVPPAASISQEPQPIQVPVPPDTVTALPPRVGIDSEQPITLDDVIKDVLENNRALAVSRVDVERARLSAEGALGAYDPVLGWQSYFQHQVTPVSSFLGGSTTGSLTQNTINTVPQLSGILGATGATYQAQLSSQRLTSNSQFQSLNPQFPTALNLSVTQPLLRNFAIDQPRYQIMVAQTRATLSTEQFRQQVIDIVASAEQAYWQLVFATQSLNVQLDGLRLAQQQAASNARRANAGTLAPVDATEALTQVATSQQSVYDAQQAVSTAETQLKTLMLPGRDSPLWRVGLTPTTGLELNAPSPPLDQAITEALANRPEISASDLSAALNDTDVRYFRNQTRPQVNLVANYTSAGLSGRVVPQVPIVISGSTLPNTPPADLIGGYPQSLSNLFSQAFPTTQVRVDVAVPIGNHLAKANLAAAVAEGRQIQLQRQQVEQSIAADVRNAMQGLASTQARLRAAADAQRLAEEVYASEQRKFQAGTTTVFLLFQRQTAMINARTQLARAQADLSIAISRFAAATGTTLQVRNVNVQP